MSLAKAELQVVPNLPHDKDIELGADFKTGLHTTYLLLVHQVSHASNDAALLGVCSMGMVMRTKSAAESNSCLHMAAAMSCVNGRSRGNCKGLDTGTQVRNENEEN